jgi:dihydrophenazinedicarboxylate synthase
LEDRVKGNKSQTFAWSIEHCLPEFDSPPIDPIELFRKWFEKAKAQGVREPDALALATADRTGRASVRFVQMVSITGAGLVFITNDGSQKGRDMATMKWASGVLYWRETKQQIILAGPVERLSPNESDVLWDTRPADTQFMSVASQQSSPLENEQALRAEVQRLVEVGEPLLRPADWSGYHLIADMVEFWQESPDRLHRRLRYDRAGGGWTIRRLQP